MTYTEKQTFPKMQQDIENLERQLEESILDGNNMLSVALCDELCELKYKYLLQVVTSLSSGTVAVIIGYTKYVHIDNAINKTVVYLGKIKEQPEMIQQQIDPLSIAELIRQCFNDNTL